MSTRTYFWIIMATGAGTWAFVTWILSVATAAGLQ